MGSGASKTIQQTEAEKPLDASDLTPGDAAAAIEEVQRLRAVLKQEMEKDSGEKPAPKVEKESGEKTEVEKENERLFEIQCKRFPDIPKDDVRAVLESTKENNEYQGGQAAKKLMSFFEDAARKKYMDLVPVRHRQYVINHESAQPWDEKSWVEKLKIAEELMILCNEEDAAKGAEAKAKKLAAFKDFTTPKDGGGVVLTEAGVDKLTALFFDGEVPFSIGDSVYLTNHVDEMQETGHGQYERVVGNFFTLTQKGGGGNHDEQTTREAVKADISAKDVAGMEMAVGLLLTK